MTKPKVQKCTGRETQDNKYQHIIFGGEGGEDMSFFHPFTNERIKDNSAKAVYDLFEGRYNVKNVKQAGKDAYYVLTRDGHQMKVKVGEKTNIFGEKRNFIKYVDD